MRKEGMRIAPLLEIRPGITAIIGGGGKTTLMYTLTEELRARGTVILCTSTHILRPPQYPVLLDPAAEELGTALSAHGAVCAASADVSGKLAAPPIFFQQMAAVADYVIVEADGSRRLPMKAHAPHEPVIPAGCSHVIYVLGADGFGKPIRQACHRPELYAALCGTTADAPVTPALAAAVFSAEGLGDRVYCNKAECEDDFRAAGSFAALVKAPVVAGSLHKGEYRCLF